MRRWQRRRMKRPGQCSRVLGLDQNREEEGRLCERQRGGSARLDGMTNISELLINIVNTRQAKDADRLGPKGK